MIVTRVDPRAALTVGNGQTAFTADVTGLQTLNSTYVSPPLQMQTHADFGWHTTPPPTGVNPLRFKETAVVARNHTHRIIPKPVAGGVAPQLLRLSDAGIVRVVKVQVQAAEAYAQVPQDKGGEHWRRNVAQGGGRGHSCGRDADSGGARG